MNRDLKSKLGELPKSAGVYFHKNSSGEIIYVGKAANLSNRVKQYFHKSRRHDPKTDLLVSEIADIDWMSVNSELEALFLEAEMVRRYMPRYNIMLRDDKSMSYIRIDYDSDYPTVTQTRRPLDDGAKYFGPYLSSLSVRQALKLLRRVFPFATKRQVGQKRASLHYHLGLDPGLEDSRTSLQSYRLNLRRLMAVIEGKKVKIEKELEKQMKQFAKNSQFEEATIVRNQLFSLRRLSQQVVFSDREFLDISKDHALGELVELLSLSKYPARIEGYDVSHQQGSDVVASMVVFTNGVSNKSQYRKFRTSQDINDDFKNMKETIKRRLSEKNIKQWGLTDLVLIDGGKGQLEAALSAYEEAKINQKQLPRIPFIGLAKRDEEIILSNKTILASKLNTSLIHKMGGIYIKTKDFTSISLPKNTNLIKLLQRIRDESHRFAVSYHSTLKVKRQTKSVLDEVPGIGPATRRKLLTEFGSISALKQIDRAELARLVGDKKAIILKQYLTGP
jgi:excinuclease ABC subunit C